MTECRPYCLRSTITPFPLISINESFFTPLFSNYTQYEHTENITFFTTSTRYGGRILVSYSGSKCVMSRVLQVSARHHTETCSTNT